MSMFDVSASVATSSGAKTTAPFNVQSGGGNQAIVLIVAVAVVAVIGLVAWLWRK